jgi:hypothetical protein
MQEVLRDSPESSPLIKIYVGGEQVNNQSAFKAERYVIDFEERTADEAKKNVKLWNIVEAKVKPERSKLDPVKYRRRALEWWKHSSSNPQMYKAIEGHPRVLVANRAAAKYLTFSFVPAGCVYADSLYVFADSTFTHFAVVQSRVHEVWARMFGTSMKDDLRYTGTTCYENYPFPAASDKLEAAGENYNNERVAVLVKLQLGLTKLSNRLNSPDDRSPEIIRLRELHAAMDKAALDAYGWSDIEPAYEFSGDYENEDGSAGSVRLNFTEEVRDKILQRLLALHAERLKAEQEQAQAESPKKAKAKKAKSTDDAGQSELF